MNYKICLPMKLFMLFCFGGCAYTITELLFRGNRDVYKRQMFALTRITPLY